MRIAVLVLTALLASLAQARASVGFSCHADDKSVKLVASGAYGTSLGAGIANFGADIEFQLAAVPADIRKLTLEYSHVSQSWFHYRDLKVMARWQPPGNGPNREFLLMIETHRGKPEGAPYRGRYTLIIYAASSDPGSKGKTLEVGGAVSCSVD
jgi:hypothetical protein